MFLRSNVSEVWLECHEWIIRNKGIPNSNSSRVKNREVRRRAAIEREFAIRLDQRVSR